MPNTTQVGASRIVVMIGSQTTGTDARLDRGFRVPQRLSGLRPAIAAPIGVTAQAPPPARLLVASMTAATMASRSSQTPKIRSNTSAWLD